MKNKQLMRKPVAREREREMWTEGQKRGLKWKSRRDASEGSTGRGKKKPFTP